MRNFFIESIKENFSDIKINGNIKKRLPGNVNVSFKKCDGQQLLLDLDEYGICASSGSACSTGNSKPSHVLTAIGLDSNYANGTLRFTIGKENTKSEISYVMQILKKIVPRGININN